MKAFLKSIDERVWNFVEYGIGITLNPIFLECVVGVGIIGRDEVKNWGLSGPTLRASGI